jgi:hypothetical protein
MISIDPRLVCIKALVLAQEKSTAESIRDNRFGSVQIFVDAPDPVAG